MHKYFRSIGDYAKDTRHLSLLEHGAYTLLLDLAYTTEKPLPADFTSLFRLCCARTKAEQDAVETVIKEFFQQSPDGGWIQNRVNREIAQYAGTSDVKRYGVFCRTWKKVHGKKLEVLDYEQWLKALPDYLDDHPTTGGQSPDYQVMVTWYSRGHLTHKPKNQNQEPVFPPDYPAGHVAALSDWWQYKRQRRETYKESGWQALLQQQAAFSSEQVRQSVNDSMASNYAGLFTDKIAKSGRSGIPAEKKEAPPLTVELPPDGYEQAMTALWGDGWEGTVPGWPQMVASDKAQVRRWLAQHGKEAA
jgi:uncharacterized protein YdaU (DUF1376 family)